MGREESLSSNFTHKENHRFHNTITFKLRYQQTGTGQRSEKPWSLYFTLKVLPKNFNEEQNVKHDFHFKKYRPKVLTFEVSGGL